MIEALITNNNPYSKILQKFNNTFTEFAAVTTYYQTATLDNRSLDRHRAEYNHKFPLLPISRSKFYKLSLAIGLQYKHLNKNMKNSASASRPKQYYLKQLIFYLTNDNFIVCFFDVSGIRGAAFKKKYWVLRGNKHNIKKQFVYNLTHIVCLMSATGDVFYKFLK